MIEIDGTYTDKSTGKVVKAVRYVKSRDVWEVKPADGSKSYLTSPNNLTK